MYIQKYFFVSPEKAGITFVGGGVVGGVVVSVGGGGVRISLSGA